MEGRKHIIQMIIGGKTQYITAAQGMPEHYVEYLTRRIRTFLWNTEATPPIAMEFLSEPLSQGGRKILDIKARNNAISITKLKKILDYSENRPPASDAAIAIITKSLPKSTLGKLPVATPIHDLFL